MARISSFVFWAVVFAASCVLAAPEVPVCGVDVGFTITMGDWEKSSQEFRPFVDSLRVSAADMESLSVTTNGGVVCATWKGHPACGADFAVTAKFIRRTDGFEYIGFSYSGNCSGLYVREVSFPEISVPRTAETALFVPTRVGEILRPDWSRIKPGERVYYHKSKALYFRCMAVLGNDVAPSHYLDQRGESRRWQTAFEISAGRRCDSAPSQSSCAASVELKNITHIPIDETTRKAWRLPYPGVYARYRGGWYEAARMRRAWIASQPCFKAAAGRDFSKLRSIDLWMWSRGGIAVSEPPVEWFMKETGLKVALDWYWWHSNPYDTLCPFFWPPRDGEDAFRAAVKRMRDAGAFVQVYTNGMLWDMDDERWGKGGLDETRITQSGEVRYDLVNPYTRHRHARMCGEAPRFQEMVRKLERTLAGTGLDGVYMDMVGCAANGLCFNPRHRHAPGGGTYMTDGYRAYIENVRRDNPGLIVTTEEASEEYFDLFDAQIVLFSSWERKKLGLLPRHEPVPASTVIFRGAAVHFGSFATPGGIPAWDELFGENPDTPDTEEIVAKYPDQFAVEFSRGAIWGIQPMVHNFTMKDVANPRLAKDIRFMKDTAKFWHDNKDFLFDGEMLEPAKVECAAKQVDFLSAGCYKRAKDAMCWTQEALPCVFHSEWQAKDGRKAAILVNWTRDEQKYAFEWRGERRNGTLPPLSWKAEEMSQTSKQGEKE